MQYSKLYNALAPLITKLFKITAEGVENIPECGCIVASNHIAFTDPILISVAASGRQICFMAKKELFKTPLAPLIKALGAFPVDRSAANVNSIKTAISLVEDGKALGIFPQGHRRAGKDPRTTEIKDGVGMIAFRSKAPVVPVIIENDKMRTGLFKKTHIVFGKPVSYDELGFTDGGKKEYDAAAHIVFDRICSLKYGNELPAGTSVPLIGESKSED